MRNGNVEARGSDRKGAVAQAITYAAYLISLTILAILAVNMWFFLIVAVVGLPATGIVPVLAAYFETRRHEKEYAKEQKFFAEQPEEPIRVERITNSDGLPIIKL